jgi:hypothetical protein
MAHTALGLIVVLGLPKAVPQVVVWVTNVVDAMSASPHLKTPPVTYVTVTANVATLSAAEATMKTRAVGTKAARDTALKVVVADARQLHAYVQQVCNANPTEAANIAAEAGMRLRKTPVQSKRDLALKQDTTGAVQVAARSVKGARSHEWEYSVDGGKSWTTAPPTTKSRTTLTGFQTGTVLLVRHRCITKVGAGGWTPPVTLAVS